ncbi:MAG: ABC transporter ATP-binding protein [Dehalococcoidia bacterium]|nr:ABC transporter ATP-binding protein [Dehalococcoidia bacterium]
MTTETSTTDRTPEATSRPNGAAPVIGLAEVSKWYGNVVAVNDVSFDIGPGITGLLGPNGAGKSTLLHMMGGLLRASSGAVSILGEPAAGNPEVYRKLGIVLEREAVYGSLSGWDFVRMNAKLHGLADPDAATRRAIEQVDMGHAQDRLTGGYSKGMKQRIKIAAAIVHDPQVLILDEPFNGADPRQRLHMIDMLRAMARAGRTVVFSSHILEEMERLGDRVLVIVSGRLAASGDFRAIRRLMVDRPHTFLVDSTDNRRFAQALVGDAAVTGVELEGDRLMVRTNDYTRFTLEAPRIAQGAGITVRELAPSDESLESVFEYLVAGVRGGAGEAS